MTTKQTLPDQAPADAQFQSSPVGEQQMQLLKAAAEQSALMLDQRAPAQDAFSAREEEDEDLVQWFTDALAAGGHPTPAYWSENSYIRQTRGMRPDGQMFMIERYWRLTLGVMPIDSLIIRSALATNLPLFLWKEGVIRHVVPFIVEHGVRLDPAYTPSPADPPTGESA